MILGIGVDIVEIDRFSLWHTYSRKKLSRIFSHDEIEYCLADKKKSAERFAVRFAAREALYKAWCVAYPNAVPPFLTLCASVMIQKINGRPVLKICNEFCINLCVIHLSLTHSDCHATALVIIENKNNK